ncbi:Multicopper oxidase [Dissulfuribacter thermophilus]|uniref:Multicopper oxidase n=1 Tax=Dissulfuribacter thermophilus TaxID=1156395 RepID=A0A1B9F2W6_9BACT|nr:multicopper oxidase domain-containing protein [Dissulfuribacter thermophilus]OCC14279.1 Multicopper oxidase [Dissulfuribacter thermophilus]
MNKKLRFLFGYAATVIFLMGLVSTGNAEFVVQCPGDIDGDAVIDQPDPAHPRAVCMHLGAGDGFVKMADGRLQYIFSFVDLTGVKPENWMSVGMLGATFPAPTIVLKEGDEFYLTLSNVGMALRPDLSDPHTVHWHGFPEAASVFDGVPSASLSVNMMASFTYYYHVVQPGTYMYHCHVEATEHMQMGMLGNLYVLPAQNDLPDGTNLNGFIHHTGYHYAYNDGDGSTYYDIDYVIQIGSFDPGFHDASMNVQPLPFAAMEDTYPMLNGRGYPDTVDPNPLTPPAENGGKISQPLSALITAKVGQKVLLRISNLNVTRFYTLFSLGIPMKVVGEDARLLKGPDGRAMYYMTNSVTLGGGESVDVILDTAGLQPGTYFLYTSNLNYLSNNDEDFGGMMTEIHIQ